jgi:hypothetical protein
MSNDQLWAFERIVLQGIEDSLRDDDREFVERFDLDALKLDREAAQWRDTVFQWLRRAG